MLALLALAGPVGAQAPGTGRPISGAGPVPSVVGVSSCGVVTGDVPLFMGVAACANQAEAEVEQPMPGATFTALRCVTSAGIGLGRTATVTARTGPCGTLADATQLRCTITGGAGRTRCTSGPVLLTVPAEQCLTLRITPSGPFAVPATINCTLERSA